MARRTALVNLTAVSVVAVALSACSSSSAPPPSQTATATSGATTNSTSAGLTGRAGDVMFAQMMIPHHQQAVEMADMALGKPSASAKVRDLATQIKAAQDPEIVQMSGWLTSWGAATPTDTGMGHGMDHGTWSGMMPDADMQALETAEGADFDRKWLTMMIAHHQGAIMMANQVLGTTTDPQVKALAEAIVKAQNAEITTMQGLL